MLVEKNLVLLPLCTTGKKYNRWMADGCTTSIFIYLHMYMCAAHVSNASL